MTNAANEAATAEGTRILVVSTHEWFASTLEAVLGPNGFSVTSAGSGEEALEAAVSGPDLVILEMGLPDMRVPLLCRALVEGPLEGGVPVLVYAPEFWEESEKAEALQEGAWDIIEEPLRMGLLVAQLGRRLKIKRRIEMAERDAVKDSETGLLSVAGLTSVAHTLGALAKRSRSALTCAVVGPAEPQTGQALAQQQRDMAAFCAANTRNSDATGWMSGADIAILAYDTDVEGATTLARRLGESAAAARQGAGLFPLSAGVAELSASGDVSDYLPHLAAAQGALREARDAGGGIRLAAMT